MPDTAAEIVYTGAAKPPSWSERLIDEHTPEAHYRKIMQKYFWVTDRPQVELAAKAAGWSETFAELYLAGSAITITAILAGKGLITAADVFRQMGRREGRTMPASEPSKSNAPILLIGPPEKPATPPKPDVGKPRKEKLSAKARRIAARRRRGIPVDMDDTPRTGRVESHSIAALDGNSRELTDDIRRSVPPPKIPMDRWGNAYDKAIGTDASAAAQRAWTLGLLRSMMMDRSKGGFSDALVQAMAESNAEIRKRMVEVAIQEAAQAFGADDDAVAAAQLLIEHMTPNKE